MSRNAAGATIEVTSARRMTWSLRVRSIRCSRMPRSATAMTKLKRADNSTPPASTSRREKRRTISTEAASSLTATARRFFELPGNEGDDAGRAA